MRANCGPQRQHQCSSLADLTRIFERMRAVPERGLGIAKEPQRCRTKAQYCNPAVYAKARGQRTMCLRIVQRNRTIVMRSAFQQIPRRYQGKTHHAMPDHKRGCCTLPLGELQELPGKP